MTTAAILAVAIALDDDAPDDTCPGCGQTITGWEAYPFHYGRPATNSQLSHRASGDIAAPWPFTTVDYRPGVCEWDRDYLAARVHRRRLIAEGLTP